MKRLTSFALACLVVGSLAGPASAQDTAFLSAENALAAEDDLAIRQVIARSNQGLDTGDYALYARFFADDAVFVSGFGEACGTEQIIDAMEAVRPFITGKRHVSANLVISGSGDDALVTSYLIVFERESELAYVGSAINIDTLRKQGDDGWVIVRHDSRLDPATQQAMESAMGSK